MKHSGFVIFLGVLLVSAAQATTYVRVEKDGTKTYSDRPLAGGHPIDVQPAQTYSAPSTSATRSGQPREEDDLSAAADFHYECSLTPRNDETFTNPESVAVSLALAPGLRYGDALTFTMDGVPLTGGNGQTAFSLPQPDRGTHTVTAHVVDRSGRTVCDASTTFHVMRTGLNSPARRQLPPPPPRPTPH